MARIRAAVRTIIGQGGAAKPAPDSPGFTCKLAASTTPLQYLARLSAGLTVHDGTPTSAAALLGGGLCVSGGGANEIVTYFPNGSVVNVGSTGWTQNVPLYPNAAGGMVPLGDATLSGICSRECGVYDGTYFLVAIGAVEIFS